eukprot:9801_1
MAVYIIISLLFGGCYIYATPLPFDGLIRESSDGSYVAYMNPITGPNNHASFLEQFTPSSPYQLGLAWFSGNGEKANKCAIAYSRLPKGSQQWTDPVIISVREGYANGNPVLFYDSASNILHCFHSQLPADNSSNIGASEAHVWHLQSTDYGSNWTEPKPLFTFDGAYTKNRIIPALTTGGVLFPLYRKGSSDSIIAKSSNMDLGNNKSYVLYPVKNSTHLVQPSIIRLPSNKLKAFFRDRGVLAVYQSMSSDDGESWEIPNSFQIPNPNVAIQANMIQNGSIIILLFNDYNGENQLGRTPLSVGLSYDEGDTWPNIRMLQVHNDNETSIPVNGGVSFSYPSVLQTNDGWIHSTYSYNEHTIKYLKYNLSWALLG